MFGEYARDVMRADGGREDEEEEREREDGEWRRVAHLCFVGGGWFLCICL